MQLASFEIPEIRLMPNAISDVRTIYDSVRTEQAKSKDLAFYLGYSKPTASRFYLRLKAMVLYGLLESRVKYQVTELGKSIAYPENDSLLEKARTKAVLNVGLWNELYKKFKKTLPQDNLWVHVKNITGIEPKKAQDAQPLILKWYSEDISHVSDDFPADLADTQNLDERQPLMSASTHNKAMPQQIACSADSEIISFDKYQIILPKGDLQKEWEKLKKYMEIKLEDYKYEELRRDTVSESHVLSDD